MNEDRIDGGGGTVKGKAQTTIDKLAANDGTEVKGIANHALGTVHDSYGRARGKVREMLDNAPAVREAVATGRDYYRRGAEAVTRNATDSTALTLLAAGVAVAAISWLIFGRRNGKDEA